MEAVRPNVWALRIFTLLSIFCHAVLLIWYYSKRNTYPIKGRMAKPVLVGQFFGLLFLVQIAMQATHYPDVLACEVPSATYAVCTFVMGCSITLRIMMTTFKLAIQQNLVRIREYNKKRDIELKNSILSFRKGYFLRNMFWVKPRSLALLVLVDAMLLGGMIAAFHAILTCEEDLYYQAANIHLGLHCLACLGFALVVWHQQIDETLGIRREMGLSGAAVIFAFVIQLVVRLAVGIEVWHSEYMGGKWLTVATLDVLAIVRLLRPLWRSCREVSVPSGVPAMEDFLSVEDGMQAFVSFLRKEFATETIYFWDDLSRLRKEAASKLWAQNLEDLHDALEKAQGVYQAYLETGAESEVNVGDKARKAAQKELKMLQEKLLELDEHDAVVGQMFSTLFQDAFDINIAILRNGAYHRFCNTLIFKSIIAQEEVEMHKLAETRQRGSGGVEGSKEFAPNLTSETNPDQVVPGKTSVSIARAARLSISRRLSVSKRRLSTSRNALPKLSVTRTGNQRLKVRRSQSLQNFNNFDQEFGSRQFGSSGGMAGDALGDAADRASWSRQRTLDQLGLGQIDFSLGPSGRGSDTSKPSSNKSRMPSTVLIP